MLNFWKKKKLHKKVLFAIAVPYTEEQFYRVCRRNDSDFISGLKQKYKCANKDLWSIYKNTAKEIERTISCIKARGAIIVDCLSIDDVKAIDNFDIVIVVAHHSSSANEIELFDGMHKDDTFVESFPSEFSGWLDLSCCESERLQSLFRIHLTSTDAHIIAPDRKTAVNFRMEMYSKIIKKMCEETELDYFDAFKIVIKEYQGGIGRNLSDKNFYGIEHLGGNNAQSSVFSPREVLRGQSFIVQVHIHKKSDSDEIELAATKLDEDTEKKLSTDLIVKGKSVKLRKGDEVGITLRAVNDKDDFKILAPARKTLFWSNTSAVAEFVVNVSNNCCADSFIGMIKVFINRIPTAEITFKCKVVDVYSEKGAADKVKKALSQYDRSAEMDAMREKMKRQLILQKEHLQKKLSLTTIDEERNQIENDLEICDSSLRVISEKGNIISNVKKVVFVSSTSDLKPYREVLKKQIEECEMVPEMYENWPQGDLTPSDACCAKVLSSDILVCVLGAEYGFVRPDAGSSMTEMELKCALQSGKPILLYVLQDYKERMQSLLPQKKDDVDKQTKLIEQFARDRLIKFITDEISLSTISGRELERVKSTIS